MKGLYQAETSAFAAEKSHSETSMLKRPRPKHPLPKRPPLVLFWCDEILCGCCFAISCSENNLAGLSYDARNCHRGMLPLFLVDTRLSATVSSLLQWLFVCSILLMLLLLQ